MTAERHQHAHWAEAQTQALVELGTNILDAQKRIDWILANLPEGADPAVYIFPAYTLFQDPSAPELEQDAAAAWMADDAIPNRFKRILQAREEA